MLSKLCVVAGVGPGIGLSVARRFGKAGYQVVLLARRNDALRGYIADLAQDGVQAEGFATDLAYESSIRFSFDLIRARFGDPEVLVYNAAAIQPEPPSSLSAATLIDELRIDVAGALVSAQAVLSAMKSARAGTILFTGGGLALEPWPQYAALAAGKAALRSLTFSLAKELKNSGVHVATVTVCGMVAPNTPFDPELIAEQYWRLHQQPEGEWEREVQIR